MPVFKKDIIRSGEWWAPSISDWLTVTKPRMDRWVSAFQLMRDRGVSIDLTTDHAPRGSATGKIGRVVALYREGDTLFADVQPADGDAEQLITRCPEVSLEMEAGFRDGLGNRYDEAITAVTVCRKPVVAGQQPFQKIAASLKAGAPSSWVDDEVLAVMQAAAFPNASARK